MFCEALHSFAADEDKIYEVTPAMLRQRLAVFEMSAVVPSHIRAKIEGIIKYIEKYSDIYIGIKFVRSLQPGILIMFRSLLWFK